jgi:hypothetical protein
VNVVVPAVGWRVLTPDGDVVAEGPPIHLQAALGFGDLPPVPLIDPLGHVPLLDNPQEG